jgi:ribosomal protein S18 acetylase RimI-like enzyme
MMPKNQGGIRPAANGDVESIADVWHQGWVEVHLGRVPEALRRHRGPADLGRRAMDRLDATTVATVASAVVGFVMLRGDEVEHLYVAAAARGGGVADALLHHGEAVIGRRHAGAWLAVVPGNARARRFYERNGWFDAGAFDYPFPDVDETATSVSVRRYEKELATVSTQPAGAAGR